MDIMIDIKTLSHRHQNAALVSIGAVLFDISTGKIEEPCLIQNITSEDNIGHVDPALLGAFKSLNLKKGIIGEQPNAVCLREALRRFGAFPERAVEKTWESLSTVWSFDPSCDLARLDQLHDAIKKETPWKRQQVRCLRTLFQLTGGVPKINARNLDLTSPLVTAALQAEMAHKAFRKLKKR